MKRVVITGLGIVSSLGNNKDEVRQSLFNGQTGISFKQEYADRGMRSHIAGDIKNLNIEALIDRKSFYRLVEIGEEADHEGDRWFGVRSRAYEGSGNSVWRNGYGQRLLISTNTSRAFIDALETHFALKNIPCNR